MTPKDEVIAAVRCLVEGRYSPDCSDRRDEFWPNAGQWTVWLTRQEHDGLKLLLERLERLA